MFRLPMVIEGDTGSPEVMSLSRKYVGIYENYETYVQSI